MPTIVGTSGNDVITPDDVTSGITGGIPSDLIDSISGGAGDDSIDGGGGNDVLAGDGGNDTLLGGLGNDVLDSNTTNGAGSDSLAGGAGNDTFYAYGTDTIDGGADNDLIRVYSDQAYSLQGGAGTDTLSIAYSHWLTGATFSLAANGIEVVDGNGEQIYAGLTLGGTSNDDLDFTGVTLVDIGYIDGQGGNDTIRGFTAAVDVRGSGGDDSLTGGGGNDSLYGGANNDTVVGGNGNDILDSDTGNGAGNDSLSGGGGADTLFAYGSDTIDGGSGNDRIRVYTDQAYSLQGGAGTDTVSIAANSYWLMGAAFGPGNGIEIVQGDWEDSYEGARLYGGASLGATSNDALDFTGVTLIQVLSIDGQGGNDTIGGFTAAVEVHGSGGDDVLTAGTGNDSLYGGANNDTVVGGGGNDILDSDTGNGAGDDSLSGQAGTDTLYAYGNDTIDGGADNDVIQVYYQHAYSLQGGAGTDTLSIIANHWLTSTAFSLAANGIEIVDGNGEQILAGLSDGGTSNDDLDFTGVTLVDVGYIDGQGGNDTIRGFTAAAEVYGNAGDDAVTGGAGNDSLYGGANNDAVVGGSGNDILDSNTTNGAGNDSLSGGEGNDTLFAYGGDTIDGGGGNDLILVNTDQPYSLQGGAGTDTVSIAANSYWYIGSAFSLAGNGIEIIQGEWEDSYKGARIYGGTGNEELDFTGVTLIQVDFVDGQAGNDTIGGFAAAANVLGSAGNDALTGGVGNDSLFGGTNNDTVVGGSGNDVLDSDTGDGAGDDSLSGGVGSDTLFAYQNDTLDGGADNDLLVVWSDRAYSLQGGAGTDTVSIGSSWWYIGNAFSLAGNGIEIIEGSGEEIYATAGADTVDFTGITLNSVIFIDAEAGNDTLTGSAGGDSLFGDTGNDSLVGGAGDDVLNGGADLDSFDGGDGSDTIVYSFTSTGGSITLPSGVSTIGGVALSENFTSIENVVGSQGADTITGDAGANLLDGQGGNDVIDGGDGNDTVIGGTGIDAMDGGGGIDTVDYSPSATTALDIDLVNELMTSAGGNEAILAFEDAVGGTGADTLRGTTGANLLDGYSGADLLLGSDGDDTLIGGTGNDVLDGGIGTDTIDYTYAVGASLGGIIDLAGGTANFGASDLDTLTGIEWVKGSEGRDTITGSSAGDYIDGARSNDTVLGGDGNDTLFGGVGRDTLEGEGGADTILGGTGDDSITGAAGNDTMKGEAGLDTLAGGLNNDLYYYDGTADSFVELAGQGTDKVSASASFSLAIGDNIENVTLTGSAGISATGNELNNNLTGNGGANLLIGLAGNDTLLGNNGNDTLLGGAGNDRLDGGGGNDTVSYADAAAGVTVSLATTTGQNTGGAGTDTILSTVENLTGSGFADTLTGNANGNVLQGGDNNDVLNGGGGADTLLGEAGNDTLNGQAGIDNLAGGTGNDVYLYDGTADVFVEIAGQGTDRVESSVNFDLSGVAEVEDLTLTGTAVSGTGNALTNVLTGNASANTLSGLNGNDTFIGGAGADSLTGGGGADRFKFVTSAEGVDDLTDFTSTSDKVLVVSANFGGLPAGLLPADNFRLAGDPLPAAPVFIYDGTTGALSFDLDGSGGGAAVQIAALTGPKTLVRTDIQIVNA
jgi:Ca2+-binding RTX toxin-like protein